MAGSSGSAPELPESAASPSVFSCKTLGDLRLHAGSAVGEAVMHAGKPLAVLAYVGLAPRGRADRDHVAKLIWPDAELPDARHSLRQSLYRLRQAADDQPLIEARGTELLLEPLVRFDWQEAERSADRDPSPAYALLHGNFLEGFAIPDSKEFEGWAESQRTRFRELKARVGTSLAAGYLSEGNSERALEIAEDLVSLRPFDAPAIRLLLSALASCGRHATAVARYHAFAQLLLAELDEEPPAELAAFAAELEQHVQLHPTRAGTALPFVGRAAEWRALEAAWDRAGQSKGSVVLIEGAAGLGKSRLLAELEARVRASGGLWLGAKCYEIERAVPYGAIAEALAGTLPCAELGGLSPAWLAEAARVMPELRERFTGLPEPEGTEGSAASKRRLHHALARCLEVVAEARPVVLAVDDLHWADPASLEVLHLIAHRVAKVKALLVGTYRPLELSPASRQLARSLVDERVALLLDLKPLGAEEVGELLARMGEFETPELGAAVAGHLRSHSGGSPLFLAELLEALARSRVLRVDAGRWSLAPGARIEEVPKTLGKLLADRLDGLQPWMRASVETMAVAGDAVPVELLARVVDVSEPRAQLALAVLQEERLVQGAGPDAFDLIHDELRRLVYHSVPDDRRRLLHAAVGLALEARGEAKLPGGAARLEHHFSQAEDSARAHRYATIAAREAGALAASEAAQIHWDVASAHAPKALPPGKTRVDRQGRTPLLRQLGYAGAGGMVVFAVTIGVLGNHPRAGTGNVAETPDFRQGTIYITVPGPLSPAIAPSLGATHVLRWPASPADTGRLEELGSPPDARPLLVVKWVPVAGGTHAKIFRVRGTDTAQLTFGASDDGPNAWSPDGRLLLVQRGWKASATSWRNRLFIMDTLGRVVRHLSGTPYSEWAGAWSPDGSRIAYLRDSLGANTVWLVDADGSHAENLSRRFGLPEFGHQVSVRFAGSASLALVAEETGSVFATLRLLDLAAGTQRVFQVPRKEPVPEWRGLGGFAITPNGEWLALAVGTDVATRLLVASLRDPTQLRPIAGTRSAWGRIDWTDGRRGYVENVAIEPRVVAVATGSGSRAVARSLTPDGSPIAVTLRWSTLDTAIARVDDRGFVVGKAAGSTRLVASAGGFRADTVEVTVAFAPVDTLFSEDWSRGLDTTVWEPFGTPRPSVQGSPTSAGRAFLNRGDYNYYSGAISRRRFEVGSDGLTIEVDGWVRFTGSHWQDWFAGFAGASLPRVGREVAGFGHGLLLGGPSQTERLRVACGTLNDDWPLERLGWLNDRWHRFAIQLRPDGMIDCWMNGELLGKTPTPEALRGGPFAVSLGGRMENTRIYHGRVLVTRGLRH